MSGSTHSNSFSISNSGNGDTIEEEPLFADEIENNSGNSSTTDSDDLGKLEEQLTEKRSHVINRLRACVMAVLVLASIGVSLTVYILSNEADVDAFEIQYTGNVDKIADAFQGVFTQIGAISALAADASAQSVDQNSTWPFQTLSNFHARGANARSMSGALSVSLNHMVNESDRLLWESYVLGSASHWVDDGHTFQSNLGLDSFESTENVEYHSLSEENVDPLHIVDSVTGVHSTEVGTGPFLVAWETSPVLRSGATNSDRFQFDAVSEASRISIEKEAAVLSGFVAASAGNFSNQEGFLTSHFATLRSIKEGSTVNYLGDPMAFFSMPVFDSFGSSRQVVATAEAVIHWRSYFHDILPENVQGITLVLNNTCSGSFTYEIQGKHVYGVGWGDLHEPEFSKYREELIVDLGYVEDGMNSEIPWYTDGCEYTLEVYPTQTYFNTFITGASVNVTFAVGMVFFYSILMFIFYDRLVESRQRIIMAKATKSTAIVASLFPKNVRDRLLQVEPQRKSGVLSSLAPTQRVKSFLGGDTNGVNDADAQPIADLFPHCTVLFADITNFTAWSSTREPAQVFVLLQSLFQAFDQIAKRRRVFKVETIGDSYVAVTGLPEPQSNHAIIMAKFAMEALQRMNQVFRNLEETLGPDTGDLGMRFGLHSGPVTAGVLKGDRARFQLFGDTVNTAARMESTGVRNRIQISSTTAEILQQSGHQQWVKPREDGVHAKGKGVLSTFWLNFSEHGSDTSSMVGSKQSIESQKISKAQERMVNWMVELLLGNIKKIMSVRKKSRRKSNDRDPNHDMTYHPPEGVICLDEIKKCMNMSKFSAETATAFETFSDIQIDPSIVASLKQYVELMAGAYKDNPFHNFSHACHVTMSVHKLLSRIVAPELTADQYNNMAQRGEIELAKHLNDYSHGIVHDPWALFAITFSAMIHDVDHQGVSNAQLAKEHPELATNYRDKSIAEQNSVDVAWDMLMMEQFKDLRKCIFETKEELLRFRQLLVNVVLATDIFDKELNALRKERWTEAFSNSEPGADVNNLRATIVIEHVIQASDVSHTMQHWHVYRKWNAKLFKEMRAAYHAGRIGTDPATFWYEGEIGFFDNYVIPLAKKLKDCNVFGVSSHEYLAYAVKNRDEWADRGKELTEELVAETS